MTDPDLKKMVLENIAGVKSRGFDVVIVHGGGPFIKKTLAEAQIDSEFIEGQRKTTPKAFEYVEMALMGRVNSDLVRVLNSMGMNAVGLTGSDGKMVKAKKRLQPVHHNGTTSLADLGQVGDVDAVDPKLLLTLLKENYLPVVACLGSDSSGLGYNINGDLFAGHMAGALKVDRFVVLTDVDGLLQDKNDPDSLIREVSSGEVHQLLSVGTIKGGMIPKLDACLIALKNGARSVAIINGTKPDQILALAQGEATGTTIY